MTVCVNTVLCKMSVYENTEHKITFKLLSTILVLTDVNYKLLVARYWEKFVYHCIIVVIVRRFFFCVRQLSPTLATFKQCYSEYIVKLAKRVWNAEEALLETTGYGGVRLCWKYNTSVARRTQVTKQLQSTYYEITQNIQFLEMKWGYSRHALTMLES